MFESGGELSYSRLKAENQARQSEEAQQEARKRSAIIMILDHLQNYGYLDTVERLESESRLSLSKYQVCDNIDLLTVIQEFETFYNIKFSKAPKFTRKLKDTPSSSSGKKRSGSLGKDHPLPSIGGAAGSKRGSSHGKRTPDNSNSGGDVNNSNNNTQQAKGTSVFEVTVQPNGNNNNNIHDIDMGLTGTKISSSRKRDPGQAHAAAPSSNVGEKLLKPLGNFFVGAGEEFQELARSISRDIYLEDPNVGWGDIIGLEDAKRLVKEAVVYPIKYPQLFTGILTPWKGLLLYGPPGTGKTMLAKAVAAECKTTFFNISASSIVSKWRGDSEKLVRCLFQLARFHAPSTIFLDELESIMSHRTSDGTEHEGSRRMKTELLIQMDGLAKSNDLVFVLAASNLPWDLDAAMLRRLEKRILVNLPCYEARLDMIKKLLPPTLFTDATQIECIIDYDLIAEKTEGYSGSDIHLVCKEAAMHSLRKIFRILEEREETEEKQQQSFLPGRVKFDPICTEDVLESLSRTKPSGKMSDKYKAWQKEFESS
eukprot:Nk52_evm13s242 gene=Nk52_evmTU13s242